jgi:hypothetical protein
MNSSLWTIGVIFLLGIIAGGCSHGPETVAVRGRATYAGGAWPAEARLYFHPQNAAPGQNHPGLADVGKDGSFRAVSFKGVNGLVPGKYKVTVECWKTPPMPSNPVGATSYAPAAYCSDKTSPLAVTVESRKPLSNVQFDVPKR